MAKVADAEVKIKTTGRKKADSELDKFKKKIKSVGDAVGGMGLASAAAFGIAGVAVANFVKTATQASIQFEQRFNAFSSLVKGDAEKMLDSLNAASQGTISNLQLVTAANNAILLGLEQEQLPRLLEAATKLGAAVGRTAEEAFRDITVGIGRQSRLILDNLGIIVDAEKAYEDYAKTLEKTSAELTVNERNTAFAISTTAQAVEKAKELDSAMTDSAIAAQQFTKTLADLSQEFGDLIKPAAAGGLGFFANRLRELGDIADNTEKRFSKLNDQLERFNLIREGGPERRGPAVTVAGGAQRGPLREGLEGFGIGVPTVTEGREDTGIITEEELIEAKKQEKETIDEVNLTMAQWADKLIEAREEIDNLKEDTKRAANQTDEWASEMETAQRKLIETTDLFKELSPAMRLAILAVVDMKEASEVVAEALIGIGSRGTTRAEFEARQAEQREAGIVTRDVE